MQIMLFYFVLQRLCFKIFVQKELNPSFPAEKAIKYACYDYRSDDYHGKTPPHGFHATYQVHTKYTGYQRGEHQDNGDGGHLFHHARHIVINNAGVGLHGRVKNIGVDVGRLACLVHLNRYVLNEVSIEFVDWELKLQLR